MNEIRHHGRELLDQARRERTPKAADRERVLGALMASAALATATSAAAAPAVAEKVLAGLSKWLLLAGLAGTITGGVYLAGHVGAKPKPAPVVAAPTVVRPAAATPLLAALPVAPEARSATPEALPVPSSAPDAPAGPRSGDRESCEP